MAKVYNPLHQFRNYQYHFIIVIAKDGETFADLDRANQLGLFQHKKDSNGKPDPTKKYDVMEYNGHQYVVFYNSMTDSEFTIDDFEYTHMFTGAGADSIAATGTGSSSSSAVGQDFKMQISEPYSVDFFTAFQYACSSIGLTYESARTGNLGLKIVFVGNPDAHTTDPYIITDIGFIRFNITETEISLSTAGAVYNLVGTPTSSLGYSPNINRSGGVTVSVSEKLADALRDFEVEYNRRAEEEKKLNGKCIKLSIKLDSAYEDDKYKLDLISNDQKHIIESPQKNESSGEPSSAGNKPGNSKNEQKIKNIIFSTKPKDSLQAAITNMTQMSSAILKEATEQDTSNPERPVVWKCVVERMEPVTTEEGDWVLVIIIRRIPSPRLLEKKSSTKENTTADFEYDYIYTGKNIDILKFDMHAKLNFSGSLGSISIKNSPPYKTPVTQNHTNKTEQQATGDTEDSTATNITPGKQDTDVPPNTPGASDPTASGGGSISPDALFAGRKALDEAIMINAAGLDAKLEIMGNPSLLAGWIYPADIAGKNGSTSSEEVHNKLKEHEEKTQLSAGIKTVKINIRMPKPSYLQGSPQGEDDNFYSSPFWHAKSMFNITAILSKFAHGKFTQILELHATPAGGIKNVTTPAAQPKTEKEKEKQKDECGCDGTIEKIISVAKAEVGFVETGNNITKYGNRDGDPWCGSFIMWCANKADVKDMIDVVATWKGAEAYKSKHKWVTDPQPGDIAFFNWHGRRIDHVGLVVSVNGDSVTTIEGNTSPSNTGSQRDGDVVAQKVRKFLYPNGKIVGFGRPSYCKCEETDKKEIPTGDAKPSGKTGLKGDALRAEFEKQMDEMGITDPKERAAMMAIAEGETDFQELTEGGNKKYTADGIRKAFKKRPGIVAKADEIAKLPKDQQYEALYGGILGNNNPGDGLKYRGRGFNQLTGKDNYRDIGHRIGMGDELVKNPDLLNDPAIASRANVAFNRREMERRKIKNPTFDDYLRVTAGSEQSWGKKRKKYEEYLKKYGG